ncbi:hypothetical protein MRB53_030072 [Persea americana]|uniref:Uncharacterized protein n=1 Tax=Persea americana TaxID=3435 RepID=A0ACC2KKH3_PERAE|nr:hypothetical protein MRB53_030072 [Persea americana]
MDGREAVIEAWYMDDSDEDQRLPHHREPKEFVSLDQLAEFGVLSWRLDADDVDNDEELKKIRKDRGYSYMDLIEVCPEKLPNYEDKIKSFFEEHLHTDEEIRYCLGGSGYFDVRNQSDRWIRVAVKKGGMIVLPAGIYHRFTLDANNYIKAMRLFVGEPVWTPYNRPHDHLPARKEYVETFVNKEAGSHAIEAPRMATLAPFQSSLLASHVPRVSSSCLPRRQRAGLMVVRCQAEDGSQEQPAPPQATPQPPKPKVSTKFSDVLAFSGPAPERINGRLAMVGFVSAMGVELARGDDVVAQLMNGGLPWFVGTTVLLSIASLVPLFKGVSVQSMSDGLMTSDAELWNGRFAMLGLVALVFTEFVTGGPLV